MYIFHPTLDLRKFIFVRNTTEFSDIIHDFLVNKHNDKFNSATVKAVKAGMEYPRLLALLLENHYRQASETNVITDREYYVKILRDTTDALPITNSVLGENYLAIKANDYKNSPTLESTTNGIDDVQELSAITENFHDEIWENLALATDILIEAVGTKLQEQKQANKRNRTKREEKQAEVATQVTASTSPSTTTTATENQTVTVTVNAPNELLKLLRVNVTCLDPMKKEYKGEIFTVGNDVIGSVRKYVPFNTTDGWHVPAIIVQQLRDKECQIFTSFKNDKGQEVRTGKTIKAYIVQELPPLTPEELAELAKVQAAQGI